MLADRNVRLDEAFQLIKKAIDQDPEQRRLPRQSGLGLLPAGQADRRPKACWCGRSSRIGERRHGARSPRRRLLQAGQDARRHRAVADSLKRVPEVGARKPTRTRSRRSPGNWTTRGSASPRRRSRTKYGPTGGYRVHPDASSLTSRFCAWPVVDQAASAPRQRSDRSSFAASGQGSDQRSARRAAADDRGGMAERPLPHDHIAPVAARPVARYIAACGAYRRAVRRIRGVRLAPLRRHATARRVRAERRLRVHDRRVRIAADAVPDSDGGVPAASADW